MKIRKMLMFFSFQIIWLWTILQFLFETDADRSHLIYVLSVLIATFVLIVVKNIELSWLISALTVTAMNFQNMDYLFLALFFVFITTAYRESKEISVNVVAEKGKKKRKKEVPQKLPLFLTLSVVLGICMFIYIVKVFMDRMEYGLMPMVIHTEYVVIFAILIAFFCMHRKTVIAADRKNPVNKSMYVFYAASLAFYLETMVYYYIVCNIFYSAGHTPHIRTLLCIWFEFLCIVVCNRDPAIDMICEKVRCGITKFAEKKQVKE